MDNRKYKPEQIKEAFDYVLKNNPKISAIEGKKEAKKYLDNLLYSKKFKHGLAHIFNPVPENEEEAIAHSNALAASGNYPVGTSGCFNVGISGGCGPSCFVYKNGECEIEDEIKELEDG